MSCYLNQKDGKKIISSFQAYCPLLDLKATAKTFKSNKSLAFGNAFLNMNRLQKVKHLYPDLNMWNLMDKWIGFLTNDYEGSQFQIPSNWLLPLEGDNPPEGGGDNNWKGVFWRKNDFKQQFSSIQSPVLVLATQKDPLVALE